MCSWGDGYAQQPLMDADYERKTLEVEERHWWYRGRRAIVREAVESLRLPAGARILDAGCGSGRNMAMLAESGTVYGIDIAPYSVRQALARGIGNVTLGSLTELPYDDESFDLITSLDVIEHIEDDIGVLRELLRVARAASPLLVTVPAYPGLWSSHDIVNEHQRRYTRRSLVTAATLAGWRMERTTHFNALLLPPAAAYRVAERVLKRGAESNGADEDHAETDLDATPGWANSVLEKAMLAEAAFLRRGRRRIPAGLSLMAIFRKPGA
jgi:SAM-dependent methyltransferase